VDEEIEQLAAEIYDFVCADRLDNPTHRPRCVSCPYEDLFDESRHHYRSMASWHLAKVKKN
jgi:hypothetical protein